MLEDASGDTLGDTSGDTFEESIKDALLFGVKMTFARNLSVRRSRIQFLEEAKSMLKSRGALD